MFVLILKVFEFVFCNILTALSALVSFSYMPEIKAIIFSYVLFLYKDKYSKFSVFDGYLLGKYSPAYIKQKSL